MDGSTAKESDIHDRLFFHTMNALDYDSTEGKRNILGVLMAALLDSSFSVDRVVGAMIICFS